MVSPWSSMLSISINRRTAVDQHNKPDPNEKEKQMYLLQFNSAFYSLCLVESSKHALKTSVNLSMYILFIMRDGMNK